MSEIETLEGGCTCGQVRYRLAWSPLFVNCCHCRSCQQQSGAAFAINAVVERSSFELLEGATEMIATPTDSGNGQQVHRCPTCKVAVWSHYAGGNEKIHYVRVGTLDHPDRCPPNAHIFVRSKQDWIALPEDARQFQIYYKAEDEWPADSLKRRDDALR